MPESSEAEWLRTHWSEEYLSQYRNNWIAVLGQDVIARSDDFKGLLAEGGVAGLPAGQNPLYAFVHFGDLQ